MNKPLILAKFKIEEEEIKFWDTIDLSEYYEPSDFKRVSFQRTNRQIKVVFEKKK